MICLDTSLILKALTTESHSDIALDLLERWLRARESFTAPLLAEYEVHSGLRRKAALGELEPFRVTAAIDYFYRLRIQLVHRQELLREAALLARQLNLPTIYDCCFLAAANLAGCVLYTADERFARTAAAHSTNVRFFRPL